ncbi:MAG: hypothetical protein IM583_20415 [Pseudanabaena sp. M114S2SP2A07QC]|nr:hypothetical protein [Pseudanabaena sp. M172S2SP2A07QC]MCA6520057.1 hypothetical protein [Pseudanabaena sp. M110S1SP2A07QC]MCA6558909.1 hypothetical protein [Pseudanabaena sp. M114S2SP2A07QC]MCA6590421.1 hypothetical protein [Pseudanabaena sp. M109S1SP1A06QC]
MRRNGHPTDRTSGSGRNRGSLPYTKHGGKSTRPGRTQHYSPDPTGAKAAGLALPAKQ